MPNSEAKVTLREVTKDNLRDVLRLDVTPPQQKMVAPNSVSIAEAYFEREKAWFRAIYADETPVGFLMVYEDPAEAEYFLWRLMVDQRYQGNGYGRQAVELLVERLKTLPGAKELGVSYVPIAGGPGPFYLSLGFEETGEVEHGERVMKLHL